MFKKLLSMVLATIMVLGMVTTAFAAEQNTTDESKYIQNVDGTEIDIRMNSVPESYLRDRSTGGSDAAATDITTAVEKGVSARASMPTGGGEYPYNPTYWNDAANVYRANCYGYVLNRIATDTSDPRAGYLFQPGYKTGDYYKSLTTDAIITAVKLDVAALGKTIRSSSYSETPGSNEYKIALVIASNDYHWYRQDSDGGWSHKPGLTAVTYKDASGNYISDPRTCDRNYSYANYKTWGGYYIISK